MRAPRLSLCLFLICAVSLGATEGQASPFSDAPAGQLVRETIELELADGTRRAERGRLTVPLRHGEAGSPNIEIAYTRLFGAHRDAPPIFLLSGGPGLPASRTIAPGRRLSDFVTLLLSHRDLFLIDQRGTGAATPRLSCPQRLDLPASPAPDEAATLAAMKRASRLCAEHWRGMKLDLSAFNTEENARDLELLRRALGSEKVVLVGGSYGSHLAFSYIRQFEHAVERAVLTAIEGPDHTFKLPRQIDDLIAAIDGLAPLSDGRSVRDLAAGVAKRLAAKPASVRLDSGKLVEVGLFDFQRALERATGVRNAHRAGIQVLTRWAEGDLEVLAKLALKLRKERLNAMYYAMDCASGASPTRLRLIAAQAAGAIAGRAATFPFPQVCESWGVAPLPADYRAPFETQVPALLFSGTFDARTPVSNGDEMLAWFPNGHHIVVQGLGHDWCRSETCLDLIERFIVDGVIDGPRVIELTADGTEPQ